MAVGAYAVGSTSVGSPIFVASFEVEETLKDGQPIIEVASFFNKALIEELRRRPEDLRVIDRRAFEELVAELFSGFGYEVELTKRTRDGGKDIVAVKRAEVNTRFLIECKRPDPGNPICVKTVRELRGVIEDDPASKAILATTTHFTKDALQFFERHRWEMEPRDFDDIHEWINNYLATGGRNVTPRNYERSHKNL